MADWIESHQDLRTNPKAKRLARLLDVPLAQAIGHLHMLWWWAIDHAVDGDLSRFDAFDIADAAGWDGDETALVEALIDCGPGSRAGFVERAASGHLWLHDWADYTSALRASREGAARGNHERWHTKRGITDPSCRFCASPPESDPNRPPNRTRVSPDVAPDIGPESGSESTDLPTYQPTGDARAHEDTQGTPQRTPRSRSWDHAWSRMRKRLNRPAQDPDKPPLDAELRAVLDEIDGGTHTLRTAEDGRAKFIFRDAWKRAFEETPA